MSMSDPIADMLTRIRNALSAEKEDVSMPGSSVKEALSKVLQDEGYINGFESQGEGAAKELTLRLRYYEGQPVIEKMKRISKPGRRVYVRKDELPSVNGGFGVAILSTSHGIMTDKSARAAGVGGEVLCTVY